MASKPQGDAVASGTILVVGLGNPGPKYEQTRHNIGFMVLDRLASRAGFDFGREKFKAKMGQGFLGQTKVVGLKPLTFMNLSGQSVSRATEFFKIPVDGIITVHDDLDLPFGAVRLKRGGGAGGHNGLKSLDSLLGNKNYFRIRMGIGRPEHGAPRDFVLQRFDSAQQAELYDWVSKGCDAIESLLQHGLRDTQNRFHGA